MRKSVPAQARALRSRANLSLDKLAQLMGLKRASSIQRYFSDDFGKPFLPPMVVVQMAKALAGRGEPQITEEEVLALAGPAFAGGAQGKLPVISMVQAGAWAEAVDPYPVGQGTATVSPDVKVSGAAFALEIKGRSMEPRFLDGDRIVVDPAVEPIPGDFVVAKLDRENEATFKQYRPRGLDSKKRPIIELKPLNDEWPPIPLDAANPGRIIGTMVEHHSYRRSMR